MCYIQYDSSLMHKSPNATSRVWSTPEGVPNCDDFRFSRRTTLHITHKSIFPVKHVLRPLRMNLIPRSFFIVSLTLLSLRHSPAAVAPRPIAMKGPPIKAPTPAPTKAAPPITPGDGLPLPRCPCSSPLRRSFGFLGDMGTSADTCLGWGGLVSRDATAL